MMNKKLSLVISLFGATAALAQAPSAPPAPVRVGTSEDVQGLVTMSDGTSISNVRSNDPIVRGARYVTSSTGSITLHFGEKCEIKLKPNQALTVDDGKDCDALFAMVQGVGSGSGGFLAGNAALVGLTHVLGVGLVSAPVGTAPGAAPGPGPIPNPPVSGL